MAVDSRFQASHGPQIYTGNELLLKGALEVEGGMHLLGGYPGSPIAGFFDAIARVKDLLNEHGVRAVINNNEALAAAMLNGSQTLPARAMIVIKSVGVHVAADALALGNLAGAHKDGGAIIVYGDDPWSDSTQVPSDSRYISKHLHIPVIEPADLQEVKDFVDLSLKISRESELYAGYILTTNLADGGGTVTCRGNEFPDFGTRRRLDLITRDINLNKRVLLPPKTWWQEETLPDRHRRAAEVARRLGVNRIEGPADKAAPVGFVAAGLGYSYLLQALDDMGLGGAFPILKLGMSYPMDGELVAEMTRRCRRIVVVEERRGFMEEQIAELLSRLRQEGTVSGEVELWGKKFPAGLAGIPETRGLHPSLIVERLAPLLDNLAGRGQISVPAAVQQQVQTIRRTGEVDVPDLPVRLPTFCPGCPHRDSADLCLEIRERFADPDYMQRVHKRGAVDLLFHGDTGCYTMLMYPPNTELMHDYSGMGLGGGTGSGTDPFITNKEVVFMGDSTFFHSGQIAISQAIKLGQDITFIVLDNRTTAMTGHQPTPGVDYDILGNPTAAQDIQDVISGMAGEGPVSIVRVDVEKRNQYGKLLEQTFLADGVKVVIADKECGITRLRRRRRSERLVQRRFGFLPQWEHMNINTEACTFCLACAEMTGCPGLKHVDTPYGPKMDTDVTWCVNDGACERIGACSAFERVTIKRKRPPRSKVPELGLDEIPEPQKRPVNPDGPGWRCCLVGVGGMGVGVATSIVVRAGHKEGYNVVFVDKKGLAIRNGGVVSQVVYNINDRPTTGIIPFGQADLLVGIDVLEAARALSPGSRTRIATPEKTTAVVNTDKVPTIAGLMGKEDFDVNRLEAIIRANTRREDYLARNISRICERYLGSKLYANIMMLGFAFQKGLIPVSMHSMAWAIKDTIRTDFRKNLYAFNMGRKLVEQEDLFRGPPHRIEWREVLEDKCRWLIRRYRLGQQYADELREIAAELINHTDKLDPMIKRDMVVRLYDCLRWGGVDYARRYADRVAAVYSKDTPDHGYAATRAVARRLASAMLIEDGVFLAELGTSPEKCARDRDKYNVNPANGDKIVYRHLWHPRIKIGSRQFKLDLSLPHWMLKSLRTMRWLRKILPGWHKTERQFLRDYEIMVDNFAYSSAEDYRQQTAVLSSPQCMNCMNPMCRMEGCPLEGPIPQWLEAAYLKQWRRAWDLLQSANNFPEFTAQICPAPCVNACKQALGGYPVQIRHIEQQVVDKALSNGWVKPAPAAEKTDKRVAVVGSGPAGLAAAQQLARAGHDVTVLEKDDEPGGLLRYGVPDWRLDKQHIDRRVEQLKAEGVAFKTSTAVGDDVPAAALKDEFDAVLLAVGTPQAKDLQIPGRELKGVRQAMEFLRENGKEGKMSEMKVAVLGGGDTGEDCVETALRAGASRVWQLEILPEEMLGNNGHLVEDDRLERRYSVAAEEFIGNDNSVRQVGGSQVRWVNSANGPRMLTVPDSRFELDVDAVVLALGFEQKIDDQLASQLGLETDTQGNLVLDKFSTSAPGIFATGDVVTGASYAASAIASGRGAAQAIDEYLQKK